MKFKNLEQLAKTRKIILGSRSPRRVELLKETGIDFRQTISEFAEHNYDSGKPFEHARKLAEEKAILLAKTIEPGELVIGADTVVVLEDSAIGKPVDIRDAADILKRLSGKKHTVCTALAIADNKGIVASAYDLTDVYFNRITDHQIKEYVETNEPMDKAGAYGIQGMGGFLVDRIEGELDTVIGLPRLLLDRLAGEVCAKLKQES